MTFGLSRIRLRMVFLICSGFSQALGIMENLKKHKKSSMLGKIMEYEKTLNNHGKNMELDETTSSHVAMLILSHFS